MIIQSLLDTDLYKLTMQQAVLHQFPATMVEYEFRNRSPEVDLRPFAREIRAEIEGLCELRLRRDEMEYLRSLRFIKPDFVDFLKIFRFDPEYVDLESGDEFRLRIVGPWLHTILFEVPILAIISEVYFRNTQPRALEPEALNGPRGGLSKLNEKIRVVRDHGLSHPSVAFRFADFGTRRRYSAAWHRRVVETLGRDLPGSFVGTSNVLWAMELGLTAIGTMGHEWLQAAQALDVRLRESQKYAFEVWAREYRGDLGIALSDVIGRDAFFQDFDLFFCKLFDGVRHDSGDPFLFCEMLIEHYKSNRIDPRTKTAVFSDSLTMATALDLATTFHGQIQTSFGIGTHLTNDHAFEAFQAVIKMTRCNGQPVAKISDTRGKTVTTDERYVEHLRRTFELEEEAPA